MSHLRIENHDLTGRNTRVYFVADDGTETDISNVVTSVHASMDANEVNTATLKVIKVKGTYRAEVADVLVRSVNPRLPWRKRLRREVTSLGDLVRQYV